MIEEQVKTLFQKLANGKHFDAWYDTQLSVFGMKTPRQMISENRGEEVIKVLMKLMRGGYMDG